MSVVGIALPGAPSALWPAPDPATGHRVTRSWVEVLDHSEQVMGILGGLVSGSVSASIGMPARRKGTITIVDADSTGAAIPATEIDWLAVRLRPWVEVEGWQSWPLGVYLPAYPEEDWTGTGRTREIGLVGKLDALAGDEQAAMVSYPAGHVVTAAVRHRLSLSVQPQWSVTDSPATLRSSMAWEPGESQLRIINDLLDSIGYSALWDDGHGIMHADPYMLPAQRPIMRDLLDDERSIYTPTMRVAADHGAVPNKVWAHVRGSADEAGLMAVAENWDPASPYSIPRRGRIIPAQIDGGEATSQGVLDTIVRRALIEKTSVTTTVDIHHLPVPLELNDAVRLRRVPAGIDARHTVTAWEYAFTDATALMHTTLRRVVDL